MSSFLCYDDRAEKGILDCELILNCQKKWIKNENWNSKPNRVAKETIKLTFLQVDNNNLIT